MTTAANDVTTSRDFVGRDSITIDTGTVADLAHEVGSMHQTVIGMDERLKRVECAIIGNGRPGLIQQAAINRYLSVTALITALVAFLSRS